jgi:hypothetical protein
MEEAAATEDRAGTRVRRVKGKKLDEHAMQMMTAAERSQYIAVQEAAAGRHADMTECLRIAMEDMGASIPVGALPVGLRSLIDSRFTLSRPEAWRSARIRKDVMIRGFRPVKDVWLDDVLPHVVLCGDWGFVAGRAGRAGRAGWAGWAGRGDESELCLVVRREARRISSSTEDDCHATESPHVTWIPTSMIEFMDHDLSFAANRVRRFVPHPVHLPPLACRSTGTF